MLSRFAIFYPYCWVSNYRTDMRSSSQATGPISIAAYMRQCLTSPQGGYYTSSRARTDALQADQFGTKGDFVTSPEISQVFGEMVGIWLLSEWMAQTQAKSLGSNTKTMGTVHLIELGPGRGTLMDDILRTIKNFAPLAKSVEAVYLVEAGDELRERQHRLLCGEDAKLERTSDGWQSVSKKHFEVPVVWVEDISLLSKSTTGGIASMPLIVAHEFFDALPIHAFESVPPTLTADPALSPELLDTGGQPVVRQNKASKEPQWRELLVTPTRNSTNITTTASGVEPEAKPDFQLTRAKASTPTSLIMPEKSERYRSLRSKPGSSIEVSPESFRYVQDFAKRIGGEAVTSISARRPALQGGNTAPDNTTRAGEEVSCPPSGAALIIDYGPASTIPINSLRGIRAHRRVSPFTRPGEVDISADVDFTALAEAAINASEHVEVYGPVEQGAWLSQMGVKERAQQLLLGIKDEGKRKEMELGWKRLIDSGPAGMGKVYKVLAVVPESGGSRRPVGFGGDVVG